MFSDIYSNKPKQILQIDTIDDRLKIDLWNTITKHCLDSIFCGSPTEGKYSNNYLRESIKKEYIINFYTDFFIEEVNNLENQTLSFAKDRIKTFYNKLKWYEIYDLLEFICKIKKEVGYERQEYIKEYIKECNLKLERNNSAFRFVGHNIVPISNEIEIKAIEDASNSIYKEAAEHINKAIELFSKKEHAQYENVIKESITAVEAICNKISGNSKMSLGDALDELKKKEVYIHPCLMKAFKQLYGYTSDAKGVRHSGDIGGPDSTFTEAKFMLVSCSAFINYLTEEFSKLDN